MKLKFKSIVILTIVLGTLLSAACNQKTKKGASEFLKTYKMAQQAQDYQAAIGCLLQLVAEDSAGNAWAYDSLAFYHYFYLITPGVVRNTQVPKYYAQKGLDINPENVFLAEIKAKLDLEEQKIEINELSHDTSYSEFFHLWGCWHSVVSPFLR